MQCAPEGRQPPDLTPSSTTSSKPSPPPPPSLSPARGIRDRPSAVEGAGGRCGRRLSNQERISRLSARSIASPPSPRSHTASAASSSRKGGTAAAARGLGRAWKRRKEEGLRGAATAFPSECDVCLSIHGMPCDDEGKSYRTSIVLRESPARLRKFKSRSASADAPQTLIAEAPRTHAHIHASIPDRHERVAAPTTIFGIERFVGAAQFLGPGRAIAMAHHLTHRPSSHRKTSIDRADRGKSVK
jgi:hypothetical protein